MSAALPHVGPASRVPSIPPVPSPAVPPSALRFAPPSPRVLAERVLAEATALLATEEHCLAKAQERVVDAERTHTDPVTMRRRGADVVLRPAGAISPESMAWHRACAAARVAECSLRVDAARERLFAAQQALRPLDAEVVF